MFSYPPITTIRHAGYSLWQSSVAEFLSSQLKGAQGNPGHQAVREHPMMLGVSTHLRRVQTGAKGQKKLENMSANDRQAALSEIARGHVVKAVLANKDIDLESDPEFRKFSTADTWGWVSCAVIYQKYLLSTRALKGFWYNDWKKEGGGNINYGVIDWTIPNQSKIGIIGDWGTSMTDAYELLYNMLAVQKVDLVLHLGDIYYSGTKKECSSFVNTIQQAMQNANRNVPFFSIPGNHEYYAWGDGFYHEVLPSMGLSGVSETQQEASYFCLRSADSNWQFLAMDTGYYSVSEKEIYLNAKGTEQAPHLRESEIEWHQDKLKNFNGKTVLLGHHQYFSANANWEPADGFPDIPGVNMALQSIFGPYFDRIAAWYWGHEHNQVIFKNDQQGLNMGRLVGASAYEETVAEDPYQQNNSQINFLTGIRLTNRAGYYNHGFAVIEMGMGNNGKDLGVTYFDFPSFGSQDTPPDLEAKVMYQETVSYDFNQPWAGPQLQDLIVGIDPGDDVQLYAHWLASWHNLNCSAALNLGENWLGFSAPFDYSDKYNGNFDLQIKLLDNTRCQILFKLDGKLWNDGQDGVNTGWLDGGYVYTMGKEPTISLQSSDRSLRFDLTSSGGSLRWNANIEVVVTAGGVSHKYTLEKILSDS